MNSQPSEITWNLLGMMNNSWYRVKIEVQATPTGHPSLIFKHPVLPGILGGGWMVTSHKGPKPPVGPTIGCSYKASKQITVSEVKKHNKKEDCWIVINGEVIDLTSYLPDHPGGFDSILVQAGGDATSLFQEIHGKDAHDTLGYFTIGNLVEDPQTPFKRPSDAGLSPKKWNTAKLSKKEQISPDTFRFTFSASNKIYLPIGQHILVGCQVGSKFVVRPYTPVKPVLSEEDDGTFVLVIKIYFPTNEKPGGVMSNHFHSLKEGDTIQIKGPAGPVVYYGKGRFTVHNKNILVEQISMVAGGTGITPLYQLARAIVSDKDDKTKIKLVYSNHTVNDILIKDELDELASKSDGKLEVWYTVSKCPETWNFSVGRVSEHMFAQHLFPPSYNSVSLVCGPPAMIEGSCFPSLENLGYQEGNLFEF